MSEHHEGQIKGLPENSYTELKPGEEYKPLMPADSNPQEITVYSVTMGLLMAVLFSAAAAYLGLKIGQVFEAAIPIDKEIKGNAQVQVKQSYAGKVIYLSYTGPYEGTYKAYTELDSYMKEKGLFQNGGPWEVYLTDPSTEPDTNKWVTEIYFPVK